MALSRTVFELLDQVATRDVSATLKNEERACSSRSVASEISQ